ncbi:hypothetical protein CS022_02440 [Veronia nyctiphanis]|uniref:Solute-binding protein family 5 domain-containing protein n=1 Tax=Veronia nyctiphanis TaxID=1278244 RepID=A0A4Q0YZ30_9GAMM|nr:ABC transporter substrate-binding protein [Veronia nyctiphanis]RXJ74469.1 hypothetical protein CS022_02440 [Veronia nyctiphanis]
MRNAFSALIPALAILFAQPVISENENKELVIVYKNAPDTLDPHRYNVGNSINISNIFFDRLGLFDEGERLFKKGIVEKTELLDAKQNLWRLSLKDNVFFHDGHKMSVNDFMFTVQRIRELPQQTNSFKAYVEPILSMTSVNDLTIDIQLKEGYSEFAGDLTKIAVLPEHLSHSNDMYEFDKGKTIVGTGTYSLKEADLENNQLLLERFDGNWREIDAIKNVRIIFVPSDQERLDALLSGKAHVADKLSPKDLESLEKAGFNIFKRNTTRSIFLQLDTFRKKPTFIWNNDGSEMDVNPLQDIRVREAISLAIDRDYISNEVMSGGGSPAGQIFLDEWPFASKNLTTPKQNIQKARALMESAGYGNGFKMAIHGPKGRYISDVEILDAIAVMLREIGIDAATQTYPVKEYFRRAMTNNEFSVNLLGWAPNINGGYTFKNLFMFPDNNQQIGLANSGRYSNPRLTELVQTAEKHFDQGYRNQLYRIASEVLISDVGIIPLHFQQAIWGLAPNVTYSPSPGSWRTEPEMFRWKEAR